MNNFGIDYSVIPLLRLGFGLKDDVPLNINIFFVIPYFRDSSIDEMEKQKLQMQREYREGRIQAIEDARRPSKILLGFRQMVAEPDNAFEEEGASESSDEKLDEGTSRDEDMDIEQQDQSPKDINQNRQFIPDGLNTRHLFKHEELDSNSEESEDDCRKDVLRARGIRTISNDYNRNCAENDESSDSAVSACSSVDSEELDYSYQFRKKIYKVRVRHLLDGIKTFTNFDDGDNNTRQRKRNFKTDELITSDMLTDSDADMVVCEDDDEKLFEPEEIHLHHI